MRVLIDECAPKALKNFLMKRGHNSLTVQEAGWAGKQNGELLDLAEADFDVLLTVDTNLRYQQNLQGRRIAIVIIQCTSNRLEDLRKCFPDCVAAVEKIKPGEIIQVEAS
ncbi:MAG: DUF5615 family PIN-like protein [Candidatus Acidiferrum sp.]